LHQARRIFPEEAIGSHALAARPMFCGMIGGYIWNVSENSPSSVTQIDVHLYSSTTLEFQTEAGASSIKQDCDWPRDGNIRFSLNSASKAVQLRLRIPRWATNWDVS
jgi:DUF1680 family protein